LFSSDQSAFFMDSSELTSFVDLLGETDIMPSELSEVMIEILCSMKEEIDQIDMMGDPVSYVNAMDVFNVNLAFTQQFVEWKVLRNNGLV
jgi:hypothetical protein